MNRALAIGGLIVVAAAGATWAGLHVLGDGSAPRSGGPAISKAVPDAIGAPSPAATGANDVVPLNTQEAIDASTTPMAQRVAILGLLNKRNGVSRDVTMKPGQSMRVGDVVIHLRACERTAPWEPEQLTGAFVQLDVRGIDTHWRRVFSGWLYKERPALNVVLHPVYDVWTKGCTVAFPEPKPAATTPSRRVAPTNAPAAPDDGAPADEAVGETAPAPTAPPTAAPAVQPPAN